MKKIEVVAAIITYHERLLCAKRGFSKNKYVSFKYEFPGGKIEKGETKEEALKRELIEELDMEIEILKEFMIINHAYPDCNLIMYTYLCTTKNDKLVLKEHLEYKWLKKNELSSLDWIEADLPIIKKLQEEC